MFNLNGCQRIKGVRVFTTEQPRSFYFNKRNLDKEIVHGTEKEIFDAISNVVASNDHWNLKEENEKETLLIFTDGHRSFSHILLIKKGEASIAYFSSQDYGYNGKTMSYKYWENMRSLMRQAMHVYRTQ